MSPDPEVKQRLIAELAARLAAIQSRPRVPGSPAGGDTSGTDRRVPEPDTARTVASSADLVDTDPVVADLVVADTVVADTVDVGQEDHADQLCPPSPRYGSPRRSSSLSDGPVPIGTSGTIGRTRSDRGKGTEPGGHPEDDLGDPETVARAICLRLLTGAARPRAALAAALRSRGIPDDVADRVLGRFTEVGLIDDRAYADAYVAAKHRQRALGATALRTELRRKGVDEETVLQAVRTIDQDAERDRARALVRRRVDAAMANGEAAARRRLVGLLARRGYSAELALGVVDEALEQYLRDEVSK